MEKNNEDIDMLKEVHRNSKMAVESIGALMSKVYDEDLSYDLNKQLQKFKDLELRSKDKLKELGVPVKEESAVERMMLWASIQMNTLTNISTSHIADMMVKGNKRGIKEMLKVRRSNKNCGEYATEIADELMDFEIDNIEKLKKYM